MRLSLRLLTLLILSCRMATAFGDTVCWNVSRGFSGFSPDWEPNTAVGIPNLLQNPGPETIRIMRPLDSPEKFDFRFKLKNLHSHPGRRYTYTDHEGKRRKVYNPKWGLALRDRSGRLYEYYFCSAETDETPLATSPEFIIEKFADGHFIERKAIPERDNDLVHLLTTPSGPDATEGYNFFRLTGIGGTLRLYSGYRFPILIDEIALESDIAPGSIGFLLEPASAIEISEMRLSGFKAPRPSPENSFTDIEALNQRLSEPADEMEGIWTLLDRSLDESLLKPGGNYKVAILNNGDGYEMIYLSGARVNAQAWSQGMLKAVLTSGAMPGLWNVVWYDAMMEPLGEDILAQVDSSGVMTIRFPYQDSYIRLIKSN